VGIPLLDDNKCYSVRSYYNGKAYFPSTSSGTSLIISKHAAVDMKHAYDAFTGNMATPNAPALNYARFAAFSEVFRTAIFDITAFVSDLFLVNILLMRGSKLC
jgi:hypothetical protein